MKTPSLVWMACVLVILACGSCRGCPPAGPDAGQDASPDGAAADAGGDASSGSSAVVMNGTSAPTTVYVSFGANSAVGPSDWPFCGDGGGCSFPLAPSASVLLPTFGAALNVAVAFDAPVACGATLAELNFNIPGWIQDTANVSLVNGWNHDVQIGVAGGPTLGPTGGADANADVFGVYPVACDICVARSGPPCGYDAAGCTAPGSCGCKSGSQYNPAVPCQYSFARGAALVVSLVR